MNDTLDTICAISSPFGPSGIGIVRISGPQTFRVLDRIFRNKKRQPVNVSRLPSHSVRYGFIVENGNVRDEVLLTVMRQPKTYTRQDMAEIGCHGGLIPLKSVLQTLIAQGCRLAEPGEFTKRAFLSGRIDLNQAEAVLAAINSRTEKALAGALDQVRGGFSGEIAQLEKILIAVLAEIEAEIEFPDQIEFPKDQRRKYQENLVDALRLAEKFSAAAESGRILSDGVKTAILGRPNVGKSSLLNRLLEEERAIVTEIPGTTRDEISEMLCVAGYPLKIIDTAGIRPPKDKIEEAGVKRSRNWIKNADLILLVLDRSEPLQPEDEKLLAGAPPDKTILVLNKTDMPEKLSLPDHFAPARGGTGANIELAESSGGREAGIFPAVSLSALTGKGIDRLKDLIAQFIQTGKAFSRDTNPVFLALEQKNSLEETRENLNQVLAGLRNNLALEFVAADLKRAAESLGRVSGRNITEEILTHVFSRFCLGK